MYTTQNVRDQIEKYDFVGKVVITGNVDTGKTALLRRFIENKFLDTYESTIGVNFERIIIDDSSQNKVKLQMWDCAGQERFKSVISTYYKGAAVAIVCVNLNQPDNFNTIEDWVNEIRKDENQTKIMLVGTKADLITLEQIEDCKKILEQKKQDLNPKAAAPFIMNVFITSAKTNENIFQVFEHTGKIVMKHINDMPKPGSVIIQSADNKNNDSYEHDSATIKISFWQRNQRKIIAGIIIGIFVVAAITLSLTLPIIIPFLASIGLAIPFTGYAGLAALAGIGAAVGLVTGSVVAGITFGIQAIVRKLSRIGKTNIDKLHDENESLISSASSSAESVSNMPAVKETYRSETIYPSPLAIGSRPVSTGIDAEVEADESHSNSFKND